jgi:hypothetical protein
VVIVVLDATLPQESRQTPIIVYGTIAALMGAFTAVFAVALRSFTYRYDLSLPILVDLAWHERNDKEMSLIEFNKEDGKGKGKGKEGRGKGNEDSDLDSF